MTKEQLLELLAEKDMEIRDLKRDAEKRQHEFERSFRENESSDSVRDLRIRDAAMEYAEALRQRHIDLVYHLEQSDAELVLRLVLNYTAHRLSYPYITPAWKDGQSFELTLARHSDPIPIPAIDGLPDVDAVKMHLKIRDKEHGA